jgi:restriction endonuclease Mrr
LAARVTSGSGLNRGVFITASSFTDEAIAYADRAAARVVLINGIALAQLMVTHNIGVQTGRPTSSSAWTKISLRKRKAELTFRR